MKTRKEKTSMETPKRPRGRPKTGLQRNKKITIRVTPEEFEQFQNNSKKEHYTSLTDYIVKTCLKK